MVGATDRSALFGNGSLSGVDESTNVRWWPQGRRSCCRLLHVKIATVSLQRHAYRVRLASVSWAHVSDDRIRPLGCRRMSASLVLVTATVLRIPEMGVQSDGQLFGVAHLTYQQKHVVEILRHARPTRHSAMRVSDVAIASANSLSLTPLPTRQHTPQREVECDSATAFKAATTARTITITACITCSAPYDSQAES